MPRINPRLSFILLLGFSSGLPFSLTSTTLQAWMKSENVDLGLIGLFSLVGLPYTFKFLWSPWMDYVVPPFLGRRRGWMLLCQIALVLGIAAMSGSHLKSNLGVFATLAFLVAFASASQDVVIDAYATDILPKDELGKGAALSTLGFRVAMLFSGAFALILADHMAWRGVYLIMAAFMGVGIFSSFMAPEPPRVEAPKNIREAVVLPFKEFLSRKGSLEILAFIILYKLGVYMATALTTPFMMDLGFSKTDIGTVTKFFGFFATLAGSLAGGFWMGKLGMKRALLYFGIAQGISNLSFMLLARSGHNYPIMAGSIAIESFCSGMGLAALAAYLMSLCDKRFTATQMALLSSVMALTRVMGGAPAGYLVKAMGWETFFLFCTLICLPGLLILLRFDRWTEHAI